jgi:hypothetical protein
VLFKDGYQYRQLANQMTSKTSARTDVESDWNGKTIELRRLPPEAVVKLGPDRVVSRRSLSYSGLTVALHWAYQGKGCTLETGTENACRRSPDKTRT